MGKKQLSKLQLSGIFAVVALVSAAAVSVGPKASASTDAVVACENLDTMITGDGGVLGLPEQCSQMAEWFKKRKNSEKAKNGDVINVGTYYNDYHANEVAADFIYKNKFVSIEGRVKEILKDMFGNPFLVFSSNYRQAHAHLAAVQFFNDTKKNYIVSDVQGAAVLSKGQKVQLVCVGETMLIGVPQLGECLITKVSNSPSGKSK